VTRLATTIFLSVCASLTAQDAAIVVPLDEFMEILVQENGRIKPMDTYARSILLQLSARSSYEKRPAAAWLADTLFIPEKANDYKVFRINNSEVIQAIGVEEEKGFRYSFNQLQPHVDTLYELAVNASRIEGGERTPVEKEFLMLYDLISLYVQISRSFFFAVPHGDFNLTHAENVALLELHPGKTQYAYGEIALQLPLLQSANAGRAGVDRAFAELRPLETTPPGQ